ARKVGFCLARSELSKVTAAVELPGGSISAIQVEGSCTRQGAVAQVPTVPPEPPEPPEDAAEAPAQPPSAQAEMTRNSSEPVILDAGLVTASPSLPGRACRPARCRWGPSRCRHRTRPTETSRTVRPPGSTPTGGSALSLGRG